MAPVLQSRTCFCFKTYTGGQNSAGWPPQPRQIIRTLPLEASRRMVDRGLSGWCLQLDGSFVSSLGARCIVHRSSRLSASKRLQLVCGWQPSITSLKVRSDLKRVVLLQRGGVREPLTGIKALHSSQFSCVSKARHVQWRAPTRYDRFSFPGCEGNQGLTPFRRDPIALTLNATHKVLDHFGGPYVVNENYGDGTTVAPVFNIHHGSCACFVCHEVVCQAGPSKSVSFLEDDVTTLEVSGQRAAGWTKNETSVRTAALPDPFRGTVFCGLHHRYTQDIPE